MHVTYINLNGNKIGNKGGMSMAQMLQVNSTLQHLDLGDTDQVIWNVLTVNFIKVINTLNIIENRKSDRIVDDFKLQQIAAVIEHKSAGASVSVRQLDGWDCSALFVHAQGEQEFKRASHAEVWNERYWRPVVQWKHLFQ